MFFSRKSGCANLSMDKARLELENNPQIVLIDVRSPMEHRQGHIPGSLNIPVERIDEIGAAAPNRDAKLFVYCLSGARSAHACAYLARVGYTDVTNIGGINRWSGEIVTAAAVR